MNTEGTDRLRLALLSAHSCPVGALGARDTGGMSVYIREVAGELSRQGHIVDIYTRVHDPDDPVIINLGETARVIHLKVGDTYSVHKLAVYSLLPDMCCAIESFRKENDLGYDAIFSHYWLSGWAGNVIRQWWRVPNVCMFHTLGQVKNASGSGEDDADLRIVTEQEIIRDCDRIIANTPREKADIISYYGARDSDIGIVPCGVNMEMFRPGKPVPVRAELGIEDGILLLFVGRIDPVKGLDRLLKSLPFITAEKPVHLLVVGGDGSEQAEMEKLRRLAAGLGIADRVTFRGRIKQESLAGYYRAADLCIVPSYYESFGLVALESLACGTPVVASDVGEMRRIITNGVNGMVTPDNSTDNLVKHITEALDIFSRKRANPEMIRSSVKDYTWSVAARGVAAEIRTAIAMEASAVG